MDRFDKIAQMATEVIDLTNRDRDNRTAIGELADPFIAFLIQEFKSEPLPDEDVIKAEFKKRSGLSASPGQPALAPEPPHDPRDADLMRGLYERGGMALVSIDALRFMLQLVKAPISGKTTPSFTEFAKTFGVYLVQ